MTRLSPTSAEIACGSASSVIWLFIAVFCFFYGPVLPDPVQVQETEAVSVSEELSEDPAISYSDPEEMKPEDEEPVTTSAPSSEPVPSSEEPFEAASAEGSEENAAQAKEAADSDDETTEESTEETTEETTEAPREPARVTIAAIGDMLMHPGVSGSALKADGSIDYSFIFEPVLDELRNADITAVNNEVPFGGNEFGLKNYPNFNVYSELGDAEAAAGFDIVLNATNHVRDMGSEGVFRTMEFWKKYPEILSIGIHETPEDQGVLRIIERNGVRIAVFNYTYGINAGFPADQPWLVDMMRDEDREKIQAELSRAEAEADFTIVFPHWGEEYHLRESPDQERWAAFFTQCGADLIIGTHPHVLEPVKWITAENGNTALCYYSLGNYISMQDETISVLGGIAHVTLRETDSGIQIEDYSTNYIVTDYGPDLQSARVYPFAEYTDEMCMRHAITVSNLPGNGLNASYPFNMNTLRRVIEEVNSY